MAKDPTLEPQSGGGSEEHALKRTSEAVFTIEQLLSLSGEQLDQRKTAFEIAKLEREDKEKRNEGWFQKLAQYLTPIAAITGIIVSGATIYTLLGSYNSARRQDDQKYFNELVQSASGEKKGSGQRIAGILLLRQYWEKKSTSVS
jgi:hypothetical protein